MVQDVECDNSGGDSSGDDCLDCDGGVTGDLWCSGVVGV